MSLQHTNDVGNSSGFLEGEKKIQTITYRSSVPAASSATAPMMMLDGIRSAFCFGALRKPRAEVAKVTKVGGSKRRVDVVLFLECVGVDCMRIAKLFIASTSNEGCAHVKGVYEVDTVRRECESSQSPSWPFLCIIRQLASISICRACTSFSSHFDHSFNLYFYRSRIYLKNVCNYCTSSNACCSACSVHQARRGA